MLKRAFASLAAVALLAIGLAPIGAAVAATPNYAVAIPGVETLTFHLSGQYTATAAAAVRFNMPYAAELVGVQASARASGGTTPTLTVNVKEAGVSVLSSAVSVTAGAVAEATITDAGIADEAEVTIDLTIGGTSPTWNDITIVLVVVRK